MITNSFIVASLSKLTPTQKQKDTNKSGHIWADSFKEGKKASLRISWIMAQILSQTKKENLRITYVHA